MEIPFYDGMGWASWTRLSLVEWLVVVVGLNYASWGYAAVSDHQSSKWFCWDVLPKGLTWVKWQPNQGLKMITRWPQHVFPVVPWLPFFLGFFQATVFHFQRKMEQIGLHTSKLDDENTRKLWFMINHGIWGDTSFRDLPIHIICVYHCVCMHTCEFYMFERIETYQKVFKRIKTYLTYPYIYIHIACIYTYLYVFTDFYMHIM